MICFEYNLQVFYVIVPTFTISWFIAISKWNNYYVAEITITVFTSLSVNTCLSTANISL